ncbi:class I adenylate-forming enzyme family protein [Blastochloris sulfoviridis]|uniref:Long-chain fatty acid--CoA ligase n=1 Tax=Blastochloris sulfoviridis TaxID=50712 RepID=A0A5M6HN00_9HYPH|nr:fatty acid--CoA ligase family protein [Blastochloris sulfoviridis]KAA5597220.1 long-chain fatty acid--CoA ligase [Blastochloris sulfoviridis]
MTATLADVLFAAARAAPAAPALVGEAGTLGFGELAARVEAVAAGLRALERPDAPRPHALALRPDRDDVIALLAHAVAGIPILPLHPSLPEAEALRLAEAAGARRLTVAETLALARPPRPEAPRPEGTDDLFLVATSGSSGPPKIARLAHRAVLTAAFALTRRLPFGPNDRWILTLPLAHVGGLSVIARCLAAQKPMVLVPRFSEDAVLAAIGEHGGTRLSAVPAIADRLLATGHGDLISRLSLIMLGGQAAPLALRRALREAGVPAVASYGLTESCAAAACESPEEAGLLLPGAGRALDGVKIAIADDAGQPLPAGVPGRILLETDSLLSGYLGRPDLAVRDAAGRFDTGDLGLLDESGRLHVEGRRAETIVTGGEKVVPGTVEAVLREHPAVREAVVFAVPDPRWGAIVCAAVERTPGGNDPAPVDSGLADLVRADSVFADSVLAAELAAICARDLPPWARPRRLAVIEHLPRLGNGKIDRRAVPALAAPLLWPLPAPQAGDPPS